MTTEELNMLREHAEFSESPLMRRLVTEALADLDGYRAAMKLAAPDRMRAFKLLGGTFTGKSFYARLCDRIEELEKRLRNTEDIYDPLS